MITVRKLKTLKAGTLRRKIPVILQSLEEQLLQDRQIDFRYLSGVLDVAIEAFDGFDEVASKAADLKALVSGPSGIQIIYGISGLRHEILKTLGAEPADWDMHVRRSPVALSGPDHFSGKLSGINVYLDDLRSPFNVGSIFRTAEAFGVSTLFLSPDCPSPEHPRAVRSSMGSTGLVNWEIAGRSGVLCGKDVFALETGGIPVDEFHFPEKGVAVIGSEELGISPEARKAAEAGLGIVTIPIYGCKGSLNVSVAFGIMMQRWTDYILS